MLDKNWVNLLYLRLNKEQRKWLESSNDKDAVEARWLEAIIDAAPEDCEDHKAALEAIITRMMNTTKEVEDYYLSYEVISSDDPWEMLKGLTGKNLFVVPVLDSSFEFNGITYNTLKIEAEKLGGVLLLNKGIAICWERDG